MGRRRRNTTLTKAIALPSTAGTGVTFTPDQVAALVAAKQPANMAPVAVPLPRLEPQVQMGPGVPLVPQPLNPPRPDSGRPEPRQYEYNVSANLPGFGDRLIPWKVLRDAADGVPLIRKCIEIRKAEVATLEWDIVISDRAVERAASAGAGTPRASVQQEMARRLEPEIARLVEFWQEPDRRNGLDWVQWVSSLLEEHFVLDAVSIYPRRTYGGDLYSFELIDGSTIKPLLDQYGGRPLPPNPAYQQLLWGFPRGEFVADLDGAREIAGAYRSDQLIYEPRNVRTFTPYGYSAVEQALTDADLYLRRHGWMRAEYTDGVMPSGWLMAGAGQADWTVTQLAEFERALNDYYAGSSESRQRLRILPFGMTPDQRPDLGEKYRPDYDMHIIKLVAGHLDTTIAELGFTEQGGLGSTGWHEGQADVQDRKATKPTLTWVQGLITKIMRKHLGAPRELEFRILGLESQDENAQDEVADRRIKSGRMTLNEDRDRQGLARYAFPEADKPFVQADGGIVFLEGSSELAEPGVTVRPAKPAADPAPGEDDDPDELAKAELVALRRWAKRNPSPRRPFRLEHLTKAEAVAAGVPGELVVKAEGGDADPKAPVPPDQRWPAWQVDEMLAAYWAPLIGAALAAGIATSAAALAKAWRQFTAAWRKGDPVPDARSWLATQDVDPVQALGDVLDGVYTDGYLVGTVSAAAVVEHLTAEAGQSPPKPKRVEPGSEQVVTSPLVDAGPDAGVTITVDWDRFEPGHVEAARKILSADGADVGLQQLLDRQGITIKRIAANRLDEVAAVLADGLEQGRTPKAISQALQGVLADPKWAYMVALTETNRASSAAAVDQYERVGLPGKGWMTAFDQRVCPICRENEDAGIIPLGADFPSGDPYPPGHPRCRCAPIPGLDEDAVKAPAPAVPKAAKPYQRSIVGVEDLAALVADIKKAGDDAERTTLSGGASADTQLVRLPDGRKIVHKRGLDWGDEDEVNKSVRGQADAEQLTVLLARAIDAPVARVYRTQANAVWIEYIDGQLDGTSALLDSRDGVLVGLLDVLTANTDRNSGNLMRRGGGLVGIDHGWSWSPHHMDEFPRPPMSVTATRPVRHFVGANRRWIDNPLTSDDIDVLTKRLTALSPDFAKLGHEDWLAYSLKILEQLRPHATGTERLYG